MLPYLRRAVAAHDHLEVTRRTSTSRSDSDHIGYCSKYRPSTNWRFLCRDYASRTVYN